MYLTVQRVRSARGETGINGALYMHGATREHGLWHPPDLPRITSDNLGEQVTARIDVTPGGNAVSSFLDVVGPDDTTQDELSRCLEQYRVELTSARQLTVYGTVAIEFFATLGERDRLVQEFVELRDVALDLFTRRRPSPWLRQEPLTVLVTADDDRWAFALDQMSKARILDRFGAATPVARVTVPITVADAFMSTYGPMYPFAAEWVTSRSRQELLELGGVRFVNGDTIVWEWPRRPQQS
jgi:hypothetical protein